MPSKMGNCRLCLEKNVPLVKSHVIPECFFVGDNIRLVMSNLSYFPRRPIGSYDQNILCCKCDEFLGNQFDGYAKEVLIDKKEVIFEDFPDPENLQESIRIYRLENKTGYKRLIKFFISVLWRGSIALHEDFKTINLGLKYESMAREIIRGENSEYSKYFSVALLELSDLNQKINSPPEKIKIEGVNFYIFIIGSIKVYIKCDQQIVSELMRPILLSEESNLLMVKCKLVHHKELVGFNRACKRLSDFSGKNRNHSA